jgi:hypothetical protein
MPARSANSVDGIGQGSLLPFEKCQQECQQTPLVGSKMKLKKVGWSYP